MNIRINIRFGVSVETASWNGELKSQLNKSGFIVDDIKPGTPKCGEITAYTMSGLFVGEWQAFFAACRDVFKEKNIQEAILRVEIDKE